MKGSHYTQIRPRLQTSGKSNFKHNQEKKLLQKMRKELAICKEYDKYSRYCFWMLALLILIPSSNRKIPDTLTYYSPHWFLPYSVVLTILCLMGGLLAMENHEFGLRLKEMAVVPKEIGSPIHYFEENILDSCEFAFFSGAHRKLGNNSSLYKFFRDPCLERHNLRLILEFSREDVPGKNISSPS